MNKCNNCKKTFKTPAQLVEHEKNYCRKCHVCKDCGSSFHKFSNLIRHQKNRKIITCDHCKENFCNEEHFQKHVRSIESRVDNTIADLNQRIYPDSGYEDEDGYREILNQKHNEIKDWQKKHLHYEVINKQIEPWYNYWELYFSLYDLYLTRKSAFKINLGFGFILYDTVNKKYKYHYVSTNNLLFEKAVMITNADDLSKFMRRVISLDLATNFYLKKPSSGWVLAGLTNIQFEITNIKNALIGEPVELPAYIKNRKCVNALTHNNKNGKKYDDNKCFFRCLALHQGTKVSSLEKPAKNLKKELEEHTGSNFDDGITLNHIPAIEVKYNVSVNVYSLKENGDADILYLSRLNYRPMHVNLYENHFSYINNFEQFATRYQCHDCDRTFNRTNNLKTHAKACCTEIEEIYVGGKFKTNDTIFERLYRVLGIDVPECDRYYKYLSVYDFEAIQVPDCGTVCGREMHYTHVPATFSICSNIPDHTQPRHVASDGDPQKLVDTMVEIQLEQQEAASAIMREKFQEILDQLDENVTGLEDAKSDEGKRKYQEIKTLKCQFETYCDRLPVIGFNSQRYDLPLIKRYLPSSLERLDSLPKMVIRKDNSYMALGTKTLQYLDITNYLAAGTSLSAFYKAYNVTDPKGFFPYEWFDSLQKLDATSLPPIEAFQSLLTKKTISTEDYQSCLDVWHEHEMTSFRDFVKLYNNLDVIGLVEGIEKMLEINIAKRLDTFKDSVSLPGLTQRYLFRNLGDDYFTIFSDEHKNVYKEMKANIVGGPSLVLHRYQEKGKTLIKGKQTCERIVGYDANSLYLNCTGKEMPTGWYEYREKTNNFKKSTKYSKQSLQWLEHIMRTENIHIRHAENSVHGEKRIQNYSVDGYCEETNTVYEFLGCFHHGHCVHDDPKKILETYIRKFTLEGLGYNVEMIYGCEWEQLGIDVDIENNSPPVCTKQDIQDGIMSGESFGFVKCDIHVPEHLLEHFAAFPPIFKNTEITMNDIGDHMREYCRSISREKCVDKALISSMKGEGIVLLTSLFKKYIEMGLVCTNIDWILEDYPKRVFEWFQDEVVDDRRMADLDPAYAIKGETSKTSGNCAYGKCGIDKTKHNAVAFVAEENLDKHIQSPFFKSIEEVEGGIHEVIKAKKKVIIDTPVQVASAVYSYAKLALINFWEFLNKYLIFDHYQLMETDTDSLYIALAKDNIDDCVKPELRDEWFREKWNFFASEDESLMDFHGHTITQKQYHKRTPGLFKEEFSGIGMICLNSKVYHIWTDVYEDGELLAKTSCKGVNKRRNELVREDFMNMINNPRNVHLVENAGFIRDGLDTKTYTQWKRGLNYFYCKRIVLADGVTTIPLKI